MILTELELSTKDKIEYVKFCLDIFTKSIKELTCKYGTPKYFDYKILKEFGFCGLFNYYFNIDRTTKIEQYISEFSKHKPYLFYNSNYELTKDEIYWFPRGQNEERIRILKSVLKELEQQPNE